MSVTQLTAPSRVTAGRMADVVQRPDATRFNLRILEKLVHAQYGVHYCYEDLQRIAARIVREVEAGVLSAVDNRILAAYGVAVLRECAK